MICASPRGDGKALQELGRKEGRRGRYGGGRNARNLEMKEWETENKEGRDVRKKTGGGKTLQREGGRKERKI